MGRFLQIAQRALLLTIVWGLAAAVVVQAAISFVEHRRLANEVASLGQRYTQQLDNYAGHLAEGERLKHDTEFQVELLKNRFGYTRPNETPIVIEQQTPDSAAETGAQ
jgi:hypothetical protein